jgi:hypothetical protein
VVFRRAAACSIAAVVALVGFGGMLPSDQATAINIVECDGARPVDANADATRHEVGENKAVQTVLGIMCLPAGHTISSTDVDWGDGTSSPPLITYVQAGDGTRQAWLTGATPHSYPRATCPRGWTDCRSTITVSATVTESDTGAVFPLRAQMAVMPVLDVVALKPVKARAHRVFRGRIATAHTGGLRLLHEMSARISWGDGTSSRGRMSGEGQEYTVRASHRWRAAGTYNVLLVLRDGFTGERMERYLRARVSSR